jgi:hypothetical protein
LEFDEESGKYTNNILDYDGYIKARDAIATQLISDWSAFDEYTAIYKDIAAIFSKEKDTSGQSNFDKVKAFLSGEQITDSRLVNSQLIHAM